MHRNILIPTDFQISSLVAVKKVITDLREGETLSIKLVHGYQLNDAITDLLFYSRRTLFSNLVPADFLESCQLIHNKHHSILKSLDIEFFHGGNKKAFQQFCEKRNIDGAYIPVGEEYNPTHKRSFDLTPYVRACVNSVQESVVSPSVELQMERVSEFILNEMNA